MSAPFEIICSSDDRAAWLAERRKGIGSSDAPTALGLSPWRTPLSLYAEKIGLEESADAGEAAYWGTKIEPLVLARFAEETGRKVVRHAQLLRSTERPWQLATLDGEQEADGKRGRGVVEIKCTSLAGRWDDGVPPYVVAQVQHQLAVTGRAWGSVAVLFNGREFFWTDVERDDEFIAELCRIEADFWRRVTELDAPEPEGNETDRAIIAKLFPRDENPDPIALEGEFLALDERRMELKSEQKRIEAEVLAIENRLKMAIGDHAAAVLPSGVTYTLKLQSRKETVMPASSFRVLRRTERKAA